jgi:NAD(P)-dependent dehydrogenase (short-subunit alcohol dehydrogenase family)
MQFGSLFRVLAVGLLLALAARSAVCAEPASSGAVKPTVLITGANRGLGLEFAKQYAAKGWHVIATARKPDEAFELNKLADERQNIEVVAVDVTDIASVDSLVKVLEGRAIDVLVNNAGYFGDPTKVQLGSIDFALWDQYYRVNALGPMKMTEALLPNLLAGGLKKVIAVTSRAGQFEYVTNPAMPKMPGHYFYSGSKAALNLMFAQLANDSRSSGITVAVVSPGQVDTQGLGMTGPMMIPIEKSIAGIIAVVDQLQPADSGAFWNWDGTRLNW